MSLVVLSSTNCRIVISLASQFLDSCFKPQDHHGSNSLVGELYSTGDRLTLKTGGGWVSFALFVETGKDFARVETCQ